MHIVSCLRITIQQCMLSEKTKINCSVTTKCLQNGREVIIVQGSTKRVWRSNIHGCQNHQLVKEMRTVKSAAHLFKQRPGPFPSMKLPFNMKIDSRKISK